ncbi:MAG: DUF2809 domain-containing protein [Planctomycetota bacterium]
MIFTRQRIKILLCLAVATLSGFWMWRYYRGWGQYWVRFYLSGSVYEIIWSLVLFFFWPRKAYIVKIPIIVFFFTCFLEFLQLWKAEFLQSFRATLVGAALIGTDFVWLQFPFYVLGSAVSIILLSLLANKE